jgi:hypothetical protein
MLNLSYGYETWSFAIRGKYVFAICGIGFRTVQAEMVENHENSTLHIFQKPKPHIKL